MVITWQPWRKQLILPRPLILILLNLQSQHLFQGTPLYKIVEKEGRFLTKDWSNFGVYNVPVFEIGGLTAELMEKMYSVSYRRFYLRPGQLIKIAISTLRNFNFNLFLMLNNFIEVFKEAFLKNMLEKNRISLVIPAYNCESTISKTILACLSQNGLLSKPEIIVVDDGSTDNTANIIKAFPVTYIYQNNSGPAKARNTGWKASSGDIVCFTDSDCIPDKNWVARLIEI